jgi:hypothetical protein
VSTSRELRPVVDLREARAHQAPRLARELDSFLGPGILVDETGCVSLHDARHLGGRERRMRDTSTRGHSLGPREGRGCPRRGLDDGGEAVGDHVGQELKRITPVELEGVWGCAGRHDPSPETCPSAARSSASRYATPQTP